MVNFVITKTLFTQSVQCLKLAHKQAYSPRKLKEDSVDVEFRKRQGISVGELAKRLYPDGIDLANKTDPVKLTETKKHKGKVLFEATVQHENLFARADILVPNGDGTFNLIEVKSDTKVADEHIPDVSFQRHAFEMAGYKIRQVLIAHANSEYIRKGQVKAEDFFKVEDVTNRVVNVSSQIKSLEAALGEKATPDISIGRHCNAPYECPLQDDCFAFLPANNVTQLYFDKRSGFDLIKKGVLAIKDIDDGFESKGRGKAQRAIQIEATKANRVHVNLKELKQFLGSLVFPIYYFDFETYAPAIPIYDNTRPWQRIPFQYSLHIEYQDGRIEHKEFLATNFGDPREAIIDSMSMDLRNSGSIVVFNQTFEKSLINELVRDFPAFASHAEGILARVVDLAAPFEKFSYYDPRQQGRYSIKVVLPLFSKLSYKGMDVSNGMEASVAYERIISGDPQSPKLIASLRKYCGIDTLGEVEIVRELRSIIK